MRIEDRDEAGKLQNDSQPAGPDRGVPFLLSPKTGLVNTDKLRRSRDKARRVIQRCLTLVSTHGKRPDPWQVEVSYPDKYRRDS